MTWFRSQHGGPAVREHRHRVRAEMLRDLNQLIEFAEANALQRVEQVWCTGCQAYHEKWTGHIA